MVKAKRKQNLEKDLYPQMARWLRRRLKCFKTAINKGLRQGRIDVLGIRDVGGDLAGNVETIAVEVKRGRTPFANACGQTAGYRVYAERVYLADIRNSDFTLDETAIASHLGIGLIQIKGKSCKEVLTSPAGQPLKKYQMVLWESVGLGLCQICDSVFAIGHAQKGRDFSNLTREKVDKAIELEKGMMFWNREVGDRKRTLAIRGKKGTDTTFERRFICPDCIWSVFSQLANAE